MLPIHVLWKEALDNPSVPNGTNWYQLVPTGATYFLNGANWLMVSVLSVPLTEQGSEIARVRHPVHVDPPCPVSQS